MTIYKSCNSSYKVVALDFNLPVQHFILDFYCHEYFFGIEVYGSIHEINIIKEYHLNRIAELENLGIIILRFKNEEVLNNQPKGITEIR